MARVTSVDGPPEHGVIEFLLRDPDVTDVTCAK
jgi:hypothetical protein